MSQAGYLGAETELRRGFRAWFRMALVWGYWATVSRELRSEVERGYRVRVRMRLALRRWRGRTVAQARQIRALCAQFARFCLRPTISLGVAEAWALQREGERLRALARVWPEAQARVRSEAVVIGAYGRAAQRRVAAWPAAGQRVWRFFTVQAARIEERRWPAVARAQAQMWDVMTEDEFDAYCDSIPGQPPEEVWDSMPAESIPRGMIRQEWRKVRVVRERARRQGARYGMSVQAEAELTARGAVRSAYCTLRMWAARRRVDKEVEAGKLSGMDFEVYLALAREACAAGAPPTR